VKKYIFIVACSLFLAVPALADDIYVRAGEDSGKGTISQPYSKLWKALERARRADVIHVAAGIYNGKGGSGHFIIKAPNLTLSGGYSSDFRTRDPFRHFTILERDKTYKGDWTGLPEGIIRIGGKNAKQGADNVIVDGFVLNAQSRNSYKGGGDVVALKEPTYPGKLFENANGSNIKIRNNILMNPVGVGIYGMWKGENNEISNNFILNQFYAGISTRAAQAESVININNNTIAFTWFMPSQGGGMSVFIGSQGKTILENNVFAFNQTEGGAAGYGVSNSFANDETELKGNVFFALPGGYYKYLDDNKASLVVWQNNDLEDLNNEDNAEDYMLMESGENTNQDPGLNPDPYFIIKFSNYVESTPGKLDMGLMNQWRRSVGLPLQAGKGTTRIVLAPAYPLDKVVPNLVSKLAGKGVQISGPFEAYVSQTVASAVDNYKAIDFKSMKKGGIHSIDMVNYPVQFQAAMGSACTAFELKGAPRNDYDCFTISMSGTTPESTMDKVYAYILKGSAAHSKYLKYKRKAAKYNKKGGVYFRGRLSSFANQYYQYPIGFVIDQVNKKNFK